MMLQTFSGALGLLVPIQALLEDSAVCEISLNKPQEVFYEKNGIFHKKTVIDFTSQLLDHLFQLIAHESRQVLNKKHPMLSASLANGYRIQLVIPPTAEYHCFSLRKPSIESLSLIDYKNRGFFSVNSHDRSSTDLLLKQHYQSQKWFEFVREVIQLKLNIVISGGTSTGKTTFLNACLSEIVIDERVIVIEDVREIKIPHPNNVRLLASKGEQGLANISIQDLVQCSLRLRPDRIICGEIRGKEIIDFVSACSTGHPGSMTTIHANSPMGAFSRMVQLYKLNNVSAMTDDDILKELKSVVDVVIQLVRGPRGRVISEVYYCGR